MSCSMVTECWNFWWRLTSSSKELGTLWFAFLLFNFNGENPFVCIFIVTLLLYKFQQFCVHLIILCLCLACILYNGNSERFCFRLWRDRNSWARWQFTLLSSDLFNHIDFLIAFMRNTNSVFTKTMQMAEREHIFETTYIHISGNCEQDIIFAYC